MTASVFVPPTKEEMEEPISAPIYVGYRSHWAFLWNYVIGGMIIFVGSWGFVYTSLNIISMLTILAGFTLIIFTLVMKYLYERIEVIPGVEIILHNGIINIRSTEIPLDRAEISRNQNAFQRVTNTGDLIINIQGDQAEIFLYGYQNFRELYSVVKRR